MEQIRAVTENIRRQIVQTIIGEIKRLQERQMREQVGGDLPQLVLCQREALDSVQAGEEGLGERLEVVLGQVDVVEIAERAEDGRGERPEAVVAQMQRFDAVQHGEVVRVQHLQQTNAHVMPVMRFAETCLKPPSSCTSTSKRTVKFHSMRSMYMGSRGEEDGA